MVIFFSTKHTNILTKGDKSIQSIVLYQFHPSFAAKLHYRKLGFSELLGARNCGLGIVGLLYKSTVLSDYFSYHKSMLAALQQPNSTEAFISEEMEAQRGDVTYSASHRCESRD